MLGSWAGNQGLVWRLTHLGASKLEVKGDPKASDQGRSWTLNPIRQPNWRANSIWQTRGRESVLFVSEKTRHSRPEQEGLGQRVKSRTYGPSLNSWDSFAETSFWVTGPWLWVGMTILPPLISSDLLLPLCYWGENLLLAVVKIPLDFTLP